MEGEFPEEMKCPICFEIPAKEIYQCKNGHTMCDICSERVNLCPQCRVYFGDGDKIRNRALEQLLDMIKYHCSFKELGCDMKVARKDIAEHFEHCEFGGKMAPFCKFMGYNCGFKLNARKLETSLLHLLETHHFINKSGNFIEARFSKFQELPRNFSHVWSPIVLNVYNEHLIAVVSYMNCNLAVTCFSINELPSDFFVEFRYESKIREFPDIRWITRPVCFTQAQNIIRFPPHMTSVSLLSEGYLENTNLVLHIFVHGDTFPCKTFQNMQIVDMRVSLKSPPIIHMQPIHQVTSPNTCYARCYYKSK